MIKMETDHLTFTRKYAKEILDFYFLKGWSRQQVAVQLGTSERQVNDILKLYQAKLVFDWDLLIERLSADVDRKGGISNFAVLEKISPHTVYNVYKKNEKIDMTLKIKLLRKYLVDYEVELQEYERGKKGRKKQPVKKEPKKERAKYKRDEDDLIDRGDPTEVATTTELISVVRGSIDKLLKEKRVAIELHNRIMLSVDVLIRESTLFGIHAERLGKGVDLERTIVKKIRSGV